MVNKSLRYFLFPQTVLSERDFCLFSYLVPELHMLQILRPPAIPEWGTRQFSDWSAITDQGMIGAVRDSLRSYQDFAAIHGEETGLASISHEHIAGAYSESRLQIQTDLRKKETPAAELSRAMLTEASVFLEMARDLDEREIELETGIAQVDRLESEFREILGISSEEDLKDVVETVTPPLFPETSLSYLLGKRMACWLRLVHSRTLDGQPVLVTNSEEVVEEAVESLSKWLKVQGRAPHVERHSLCRIPGPVATRLQSSPSSESERPPLLAQDAPVHLLQVLSEAPADRPFHDDLERARKACAEWLSSLGALPGSDEAGDLELSVVGFAGVTVADLWKCLDRSWPHMIEEAPPQGTEGLLFLVLGKR